MWRHNSNNNAQACLEPSEAVFLYSPVSAYPAGFPVPPWDLPTAPGRFPPRLFQFRERSNTAMRSRDDRSPRPDVRRLCLLWTAQTAVSVFFSPFLSCLLKAAVESLKIWDSGCWWATMYDDKTHTHTHTQYFLSFLCNSEPLCLSLPPRYPINPQTFIPDETEIAVTTGTNMLFIR